MNAQPASARVASTAARTTRTGRRGGFPSHYRTLSPLAKAQWLEGAECKQLVTDRRLQFSQVTAEQKRLRKRSAEISRIVPTRNRLDEFEEGYPFPPQADSPGCAMVRAEHVLCEEERPVYWPANYVTEDRATFDVVCLETYRRAQRLEGLIGLELCKQEGGTFTTSSPSVEAICRAQEQGSPLVEAKLDPEDEEALRQEIADQVAAMGARPVQVNV